MSNKIKHTYVLNNAHLTQLLCAVSDRLEIVRGWRRDAEKPVTGLMDTETMVECDEVIKILGDLKNALRKGGYNDLSR